MELRLLAFLICGQKNEALPSPQKHLFLQPGLALISPHTSFTQKARKEGESKARGQRGQSQNVQGQKGPKATQLVWWSRG